MSKPKSKKPTRRTSIIFTVGILLGILVTVLFVQATTPPPYTFTISGGVYSGASSYTVWVESGYYYAKDAYGLQPAWSGSANASYVIQMAMDLCYAITRGGLITFEHGHYDILTTLVCPRNIRLQGLSRQAWDEAVGLVQFHNSNGVSTIINADDDDTIEYIQFLSDNSTSDTAILIDDAPRVTVKYCMIENFYNGIVVSGDSWETIITHNQIIKGTRNKAIIFSTGGYQYISEISYNELNAVDIQSAPTVLRFVANDLDYRGALGYILKFSVGEVYIADCHFETDVPNIKVIDIEGGHHIEVTRIYINAFNAVGSVGLYIGVGVGWTFIRPPLDIINTATSIINMGSFQCFIDNIDSSYKTSNTVLSDAFSINSTGTKTVTIPHGLQRTPDLKDVSLTVVSVEYNEEDWAYAWIRVYSVDATNVVAQVKISVASATSGATMRFACTILNGGY